MTAIDHEHEAEKAEYRRDTSETQAPKADAGREALLPCPFCGDLPQIIEREVEFTPPLQGFSFASGKGKSIACVNKMCGMQPATHPCPPENIGMFRLNWNMRAQPDKAKVVERVARALCREARGDDNAMDRNQQPLWKQYVSKAQATLPPQAGPDLAKELATARGVIAEWERDMRGTLAALEAERAKAKELADVLADYAKLGWGSDRTISKLLALDAEKALARYKARPAAEAV